MDDVITQFIKSPSSALPFYVNWTEYNNGANITDSIFTFTPNDGSLAISSHNFTNSIAVVWFTGGKLGRVYRVINRVTLDTGVTDERVFEIKIGYRGN